MNTMITTLTDRGQVSIPAAIRRRMRLKTGSRVLWESVGDDECLIVVRRDEPVPGPMAMRGHARTFRETRRTADWLSELRSGEET